MTGKIGNRFGGGRPGGPRATLALGIAILLMTAGVSPALADEQPPAPPPTAADAAAASTSADSTPASDESSAAVSDSSRASSNPPAAPAARFAAAAATGVLSVNVTITDTSGNPITVVDASLIAAYRVNIAYSCSTADCPNTIVSVAAPPKDPYYNTQLKESAVTYTPPFTPAPALGGSLAAGYTINLGTVTAGTNGLIRLDYTVNNQGALSRGNFFPDGSPITPTVTMTSTNAPTVTGSASATWKSYIPTPSLALSTASVISTNTPRNGHRQYEFELLATFQRRAALMALVPVRKFRSGHRSVASERDLCCGERRSVRPGRAHRHAVGGPQCLAGLDLELQGDIPQHCLPHLWAGLHRRRDLHRLQRHVHVPRRDDQDHESRDRSSRRDCRQLRAVLQSHDGEELPDHGRRVHVEIRGPFR